MTRLSVLMAAVLVMFANLSAMASDDASAPSNVRITIEVATQDETDSSTSRTYELISPVNGNSSITLGRRVPIPIQISDSPDSDAPESGSITKFSYQDVGFKARIDTQLEEGRRLRISGHIEISSVLEEQQQADSGDPPMLEAVVQRFDVLVEDGASIRLLSVAESASSGLAIHLKTAFLD